MTDMGQVFDEFTNSTGCRDETCPRFSKIILLLTGSMDIAVDIVLFIQKTVIIYYFYRVVSLISFAYVVWDKPPCRFQPLWYTALIKSGTARSF